MVPAVIRASWEPGNLGTQLTLVFPFGLLRLLRSFRLGKLELQLQPSLFNPNLLIS